ncbi:hypothetical protein ACFWXK_14390 [Streptomyces sp. NPDC059070]|uniref:hypothetical protein n=1 Tax=Streptomyces sp. NPDC059070 TaxID=3346713 RepID=UPI0036970CBB
MSTQYSCENAADPDLYARLMEERYGPLPKLLAEGGLSASQDRSSTRRSATVDADAARHYAELADALAGKDTDDGGSIKGQNANQTGHEDQTPPVPGAE